MSCGNDQAIIHEAAKQQGQAAARVTLPPQPPECRQTLAHAPVAIGLDPVLVLAGERRVVNRLNGVVKRCAGFYDATAAALR